MPGEFEFEIIQRLTRIEAKQDNTDSKVSQLYEFHNQNQKQIDKVDAIEKAQINHHDGHEKWRLAISVPIIVGAVTGLYNLIKGAK